MSKANTASFNYRNGLADARASHGDALLVATGWPDLYPQTAKARRLQLLDWLRPLSPRPELESGKAYVQSDQDGIDYRTGYAVGLVESLMLAEVNREGN
jgi:hypothetical protein